jgi:MFS family permease
MPTSRIPIPKIAWKELLPALFLVFNSLVWYTLTYAMFSNAINALHAPSSETLLLFTVYYLGIACSGILGAMLSLSVPETYLLMWMLTGAIMTALLPTIANNITSVNILISLFLGIVAGMGLPSCLAYFADATVVENRGLYGGITWATIGFGTLIFVVLVTPMDLGSAFTTLAAWRIFGVIAFFFLSRSKGKIQQKAGIPAYRSILQRREVVLYLVPWIMFSLVNFAEAPLLEKLLGDFYMFVGFVEFAISGVSAVIGGWLSDLVGRKRVVITAFIILGIEYAVLSLFSGMQFSWYLYTVLDGCAWGMFASVFFMTLWGDLAGNYRREKYYALGGIPYFLAGFLPIIIKSYAGGIQTGAAFSLASFFLFLAVLPLMYAPETLPEKTIQQRELEKYVGEAKKFKEKSERKK